MYRSAPSPSPSGRPIEQNVGYWDWLSVNPSASNPLQTITCKVYLFSFFLFFLPVLFYYFPLYPFSP